MFVGLTVSMFGLATVTASAAPSVWTVTRTHDVEAGFNVLSAVSCPARNRCVAVGTAYPNPTTQVWNGRRWLLSAGPRDDGAISCTSPTSCVAVGWDGSRPVADVWDGAAWSPTVTPDPGHESYLSSVSCVSVTWCMAVGTATRPFFDVFDGTTWSSVPAAKPGAYYGELTGVSCTSTVACVAVGYETCKVSCGQQSQTVSEVWDGVSWTKVAPRNIGHLDNRLTKVSCSSATRCVAVGRYDVSATQNNGYVQTWNGSRWRMLPMPLAEGATSTFLAGVSCRAHVRCVVTGNSTDPSGTFTLIAAWDGTSWSYVSSPLVERATLESVDCFSNSQCVAVGDVITSSHQKTLGMAGTAAAIR